MAAMRCTVCRSMLQTLQMSCVRMTSGCSCRSSSSLTVYSELPDASASRTYGDLSQRGKIGFKGPRGSAGDVPWFPPGAKEITTLDKKYHDVAPFD